MTARLQFVYGAPGGSVDWLHVPQCRLAPYVEMLPRVEAQREMQLVRATSSVWMEQADRRQYLHELERRQAGGKAPRPKPDRTALAAMGIVVVEE